MLKIFKNKIDITEHVEYKTLKISESLNNRRNTAKLTVINHNVEEGQEIEVFS